MKITKHEHAFLEITKDSQTLLIDPGVYTPELPLLSNVVGITISHIHDDHSYLPHIAKLVSDHPGLRIFGPSEVANKLRDFEVSVCYHGDHHRVGNFSLEFTGDLHQEIHRSIPMVQNLAVLVDSKLFYPGDAYTYPDSDFEVLACPSAAPWMQVSDLIDYLTELKPKFAFATHNAILSDHGHALQNNRIKEFVEKNGGKFQYLTPGQSIEI